MLYHYVCNFYLLLSNLEKERSEINQCQIMLKDILKLKPKGAPEIKAQNIIRFSGEKIRDKLLCLYTKRGFDSKEFL